MCLDGQKLAQVPVEHTAGCGSSAEVGLHPPSQDWLVEQVTEVGAG